jgi:hypothetical protein
MAMRGKIIGLLLAAITMAAAPALADGRGHRGDDRHWDRGHHGKHWDRGHRGKHWKHGRHWDRGHHRDRYRHKRHHRPVIVVPHSHRYGRPYYRYAPPRPGGIYLFFDLSALFDAPIGAPVRWQDDNGAGTLVTTAAYNASDGRYCREYQKTVTVSGRLQEAWGTACLQPDGDWQIVSERN